MTTRICPVGSIGLQKLWPEIVSKREMGEGGERMRDRQTDRKREREGGGRYKRKTEIGSRKRRINDIILPNPSCNGCKKVSSSFSPLYKVSVSSLPSSFRKSQKLLRVTHLSSSSPRLLPFPSLLSPLTREL